MKSLGALHDYVKDNYEQGNYESASRAYQDWKNTNSYSQGVSGDDKDDYQSGYCQAQYDYEVHGKFQRFSASFIKIINLLSNDKAVEVARFIEGYNAYKEKQASSKDV